MAGVSKVVYGSDIIIDLTHDTVTKKDLVKGVTAHDKQGNKITGTINFDTVTSANSKDIVKGVTVMDSSHGPVEGSIDFDNATSANSNDIVAGVSVLDVNRNLISGSIDFSNVDVTPEDLAENVVAMSKSRIPITGTIPYSSVNVTSSDLPEGISAIGSDKTVINGRLPYSRVQNVTPQNMMLGTVAFDENRMIVEGTLDFTQDTARAENLLKGKVAHTQNGEKIVGTAEIAVYGVTLVMPEGLISVS